MLAALILGSVSVFGQMQLPQLPVDSAVRVGKLDNGMTYYIRHNENPKGQADFYIAQKVGSILEEDNQRGLAHFLEHMCFNGTENFPGKNMIKYLESIGVRFGVNLNAYTSIDETVYNISDVPVARKGVQDSCLLILHDWACALTLAPEEIDAERGVIHEEWRQSNKGNMRIIEQQLPKIYPNNKYGYRLPIGTMEVVDNFPYQALIDYYHTWYRPDQQGIIVVGDIDPDYIEGQIKKIFSTIPMPENAKERVYVAVEDTPGTIYAIGSDKEMAVSVIMMSFKTDTMVPDELKNTQAFLITEYLKNLIASMLNNRLADLAKKPDSAFADASVDLAEFFVARTKDALNVQIVAKEGMTTEALKEVYREIQRATRTGFTVGEYERARAEFLSSIEKAYNNRNNTKTASYVNEYVKNFIEGEPIPGISYEYEFYNQIAPMLPIEAINSILPEIVKDDNRILLLMLPESEKVPVPTEEELAAAMAAVDAETLEAYMDEMKSEPLIPNLPKPGKIKKETELAEWGATELLLSNGVKVIVKPTAFKDNEIVMDAMAIGGMSVLPDEMAASIKFFPMALMEHGLGDYTSTDVKKYLQGKQANVSFAMDMYNREIEGRTTVKDLPTMMELLYMTFTDVQLTDEEFAATQNSIKGILSNQESTPEFIFSRDLMKTIFSSPKRQALVSADIEAATKAETLDIMRQMTANAADYTFVFVGNIDMDTFRPLVEQYIATLPADAKKATKEYKKDLGLEPKKGNATTTYTTAMETPQSWVFIVMQGNENYNGKNKLAASAAGQILSNRLLAKVREEMGATYSIFMKGDMTRQGDNNIMFQSAFPMKPEMKDEVLVIIRDIIEDMAQNATEEEFAPAKEYLLKEAQKSAEENDDWAGAIAASTLNGVNTFTSAVEEVNALTLDDVKALVRDILSQNNYQVVVLDPEVKE